MRIQGIALIMVGVLHMFRQAMPSVEAAFVRAPMPLAFASVNKRTSSRRALSALLQHGQQTKQIHTTRMSLAGGQPEPPTLTVSTFNIWCPLFRRMHGEKETGAGEQSKPLCESSFRDLYLERNRKIIKLLDELDSDIICLQEFWVDNQELIDLYKSHFSQKYSWSQLERTGDRGDGLVTLVKQEIAVRDKRDIIFRDLGDRVAMLVRLQIPFVGEDGKETNAEVVVVNTHLLFPHKPYFSIIRLRELRKILGFLELYRLQHRRDLPILMMGDFNGCPNEATYTYMAGRNFSSSCERDTGWVTHKNHLGESVCVDYIWLQNPSDRSGPIDHGWTDMLFRSTRERILSIGQPDLPVDMGLAPGAEGGDPPTVNVHDDNVTAYRETLNLLGFGVASDGLSDRDLQMLMEGPDRKFRGQDRVLTEKDLFSLCDVNSSGGLDFTEFKKFIKTLGVPNTGGSMHRNLFDSIDKSKKGHIDSAEFEEWWVQNTSGGSENSVLSKVSMEAVEVALCAMSEGIEVNHESDAAVLKDDQDDSAETSGMDLSMKMLEMCELERVTSELTPKVMEIGKFTFDLSDHAVVTSKFLIKPARARLGRARNSTDASGESKNEDPVVGLRQG